MNEWTSSSPVIDLPLDPAPEPPAAGASSSPRPRRRRLPFWQQSLIVLAGFCLTWSGFLVLVAQLLPGDAAGPILVTCAAMTITWGMIAAIAWRTGRLV